VLGLDLTGENETVIRGPAKNLLNRKDLSDREPIALLLPKAP
jgi:hypothetical protein